MDEKQSFLHALETEKDEETTTTEDDRTSIFWEDLWSAIYDVRLSAPFVALLAFFLAYQLTIAPYRVTIDSGVQTSTAIQDLKYIRPVLNGNQMATIQKTTLFAETSFVLPQPHADTIRVRFHQSVNKHGNHRLPAFFYDGVTFGISSENPHNLEYTAQNHLSTKQLKADLAEMPIQPTFIMERWATYNDTIWNERGYAVYFSYDDLSKQGKLSSDILQPWKRIVEDVLTVARKHKQVYITVWYPHQFGGERKRSLQESRMLIEKAPVVPIPVTKATFTEVLEDNSIAVHEQHRFLKQFHENYRHINIIQQIIPTRTGLDGIKSSAAVWVSAINGSDPFSFQQKLALDW